MKKRWQRGKEMKEEFGERRGRKRRREAEERRDGKKEKMSDR